MRLFLTGLCCFVFVIAATRANGQTATGFSRSAFYRCMAGTDGRMLDQQLEQLNTGSFPGRQAFEGALLMKKAGMVSGAKKKLEVFKDGHRKLEAAIKKDSGNPEYRLLRLMIQEHAPKVLGYRDNIQSDRQFLEQHFDELPGAAQQAASDYHRQSGAGKPEKP